MEMKKSTSLSRLKRFAAALAAVSIAIICLLTQSQAAYAAGWDSGLVKDRLYEATLVWNSVYNNYGLWETVPELDWNDAFVQCVENVIGIESSYEYSMELFEFLAKINDGHSRISGKKPWISYPGITIEYVEGKFYVTDPQNTDIPLYSEVLKIDGQPAKEYITDQYLVLSGSTTEHSNVVSALRHYFFGESGTSVEIVYKTVDGKEETEIVMFNAQWCDLSVIDERRRNIPFEAEYLYPGIEAYLLPGGIVYIIIDSFMVDPCEGFDKLIEENGLDKTAAGFIIDLRQNGGGNEHFGLELFRRFTDYAGLPLNEFHMQEIDKHLAAKASLIIDKYDDHEDLINTDEWDEYLESGMMMLNNRFYNTYLFDISVYVAQTITLQKPELTQPAIILSSYMSGSAAESIMDKIKADGKFLILGTNTNGGTGTVLIDDLPISGSVGISSQRCFTSEGYDIQNNGVQPHVWSEQTYDDMLENKDTTLLLAIDLINMAGSDPEGYEQYITDNKYIYDIEPLNNPENLTELVFERLKKCGTPDGVLTDGEKVLGLAEIWRRVTNYYTGFDNLSYSAHNLAVAKWNAAYKNSIPLVLECGDLDEYYGFLQEFIALIGDPGCFVVPPGTDAGLLNPEIQSAVFALPEGGRFYVAAPAAEAEETY